MRYIFLHRPLTLPTDFFSCFPLHQRLSFSEIQELAGRGRAHPTEDGVVLLVRQRTLPPPPDSQRPVGRAACVLNDEPVRICVPLLMRPWAMQAYHSTAPCHLGTMRTQRMLEHFYWWIVVDICTRSWLHNCLKCQAWKTSRLTVRWPIISMPLPGGPGIGRQRLLLRPPYGDVSR